MLFGQPLPPPISGKAVFDLLGSQTLTSDKYPKICILVRKGGMIEEWAIEIWPTLAICINLGKLQQIGSFQTDKIKMKISVDNDGLSTYKG
jgi:hypothetical protein